MKTGSSFFPTNTSAKLHHNRHDRTYNVIRKPQNANDSYRTLDNEHTRSNIFREMDHYSKKYSIEQANARPVGGMQLFRKMDQARDRNNENRKYSKKTNIEVSQRIINTSSNGNRFKRQRLETQGSIVTEKAQIKQIRKSQPCETKEQEFKSSYTYFPEGSSFKLRTKGNFYKSTHKSEFMLRPKSESKVAVNRLVKTRTEMQQEWADEQFKSYHDKMAIINEINYNRPLVEVYGDQYFENTLRNRFEENLKPPAYIYIIKDKFTDAKVISKLRSNYFHIYDISLVCNSVKKWFCEDWLWDLTNDSFSSLYMSINESQTKDGMYETIACNFTNDETPHNQAHDDSVDIEFKSCPFRQPSTQQIDDHTGKKPERQQIDVSAAQIIYIPAQVPPSFRSRQQKKAMNTIKVWKITDKEFFVVVVKRGYSYAFSTPLRLFILHTTNLYTSAIEKAAMMISAKQYDVVTMIFSYCENVLIFCCEYSSLTISDRPSSAVQLINRYVPTQSKSDLRQ